LQIFKWLLQSPHRLVAVMPSVRVMESGPSGLEKAAQRENTRVWPGKLVKSPDFARSVRDAEVDILLNVHSLYVVHPDVLAAPRVGCFNLHPGPLPRYAGLNSVSWAIYHGESSHGVTVHRMEAGIDTGDIAYQSLFPILESDSALSLYSRCIREGVSLLERLLVDALSGAIPRIPQDPARREYFGKTVPNGGVVDWKRSAREVLNFVRACEYFPFPSPWGHPRSSAHGRDFALVRAEIAGPAGGHPPGTVGDVADGRACIACQDNWLRCQKILLDGKIVPAGVLLRPGMML
jgi:methionyl-tRNA formyltransferase